MRRERTACHWDVTDPSRLPPDERLVELTAILAAGARRAIAIRSTTAELLQESAQIHLDVSPESRLHGPRGVNATREDERR